MAQVIYGNQFQGGLVRIPPSKSAAHRQVLCAALSRGKCTLSHVDMSEDIQATVAAVEALGAKVSFDEAAATLTLDAANLGRQNAAIDCRESGSTLRFLIPIAAALGVSARFVGRGRLPERPLGVYGELLPAHGVEFRSQGGLPLEISGKLKSGVAWWLSKASVLYTIAVAQALVMVGALHAINGFDPARMGQTLLVACVASVTFMSVMYFFTNLMGKVGSFLMLVFMVIQLAGSVGTYPLELSGSFVKYLHDWVPFTYTVTAFRRAICGGESVTGCLAYLAVWLVVFTLLTILVFTVRARRIKAEKPTLMVWLEQHRLA